MKFIITQMTFGMESPDVPKRSGYRWKTTAPWLLVALWSAYSLCALWWLEAGSVSAGFLCSVQAR